ncbi:hypothetical protein DAT35_50985 [Vitiosangium sp. GDMCC 1.1324]|nr:hypothetical protein DAT35_50985 [Vitiosangium sp. GDMCC 1.1324]
MDTSQGGLENWPRTIASVRFGEERFGDPPPYLLAFVFRLHHRAQEFALQRLELGFQRFEGITKALHEQLVHRSSHFQEAEL